MSSKNEVSVFSWHFMPWPYLNDDFDRDYESGWITVPNSLFDRQKMVGLYQEYLDELAAADGLGFDGVVLNEHHQNIYGMMPAPNLLAAALTQITKTCKLVVLGNLLPLHFRPLRVAEEYAMLDCMSNGRVVAGFAPGGGHEAFSYSYSMPLARERFWEGVDLIVQAWTQPGPTTFEGKHYSMRYVNPWPQPLQTPHPPIWIPGANSVETMYEVARRGFCYFLSTRGKLSGAKRSALRFGEVVEEIGKDFHPRQMGLLFSVYVAETDEIAREESEEAALSRKLDARRQDARRRRELEGHRRDGIHLRRQPRHGIRKTLGVRGRGEYRQSADTVSYWQSLQGEDAEEPANLC
jgi:alkanesulfonate monooxygenase SsuD/methylene tetrahydromethanopterin reductase-like flavin-dependent oxidoreductase (luciferase family)